jgi:hypothetical protein
MNPLPFRFSMKGRSAGWADTTAPVMIGTGCSIERIRRPVADGVTLFLDVSVTLFGFGTVSAGV